MKTIETFENRLNQILISFTPFLASLIPAVFLCLNLITFMELKPIFSALIALATESIGISSLTIYLKVKQFNKRYKDPKNHVPSWPPVLAYSIYISAILITNVILEINLWNEPQKIVISISKGLLSLMSLSGALLIASNSAISYISQKNKRTPQPKTPKSSGQAEKALPVYLVSDWTELDSEMRACLSNGHTPRQLDQIFPKVTRRTINRWKTKPEIIALKHIKGD